MNAKVSHTAIFLTPICLVLFVTFSYGMYDLSGIPADLQLQLDQNKELAYSWNFKGNLELLLGILVTFLGAFVAVLQGFKDKKWIAYVVAFCGISITTITYGTNEYFYVDQKTYRKSSEKALKCIETAECYLKSMHELGLESEGSEIFMKSALNELANIESIERNIVDSTYVFAASPSLITSAYAQKPSRPAWVSQTESETRTTYRFVGSSTAVSVADAQTQALENARKLLSSELNVPLNLVERFSVLIQTHLEYNAENKTFQSFALIELNKAFVRH